jgi:hypothetical protein
MRAAVQTIAHVVAGTTPKRSHKRKEPVPVTQPKPSSIGNRAMLAALTVHRWTPNVVDRKASDEVADNHNSDTNMGRYTKQLIDHKALGQLTSLMNELRKEHQYRTLPWIDGGVRLLSNAGYFKYTEKIRELRDQYDAATLVFLNAYKGHIVEAKKRLGTLFNEAEYPTVAQLKHRFGVELRISPVPNQADFRVDLGDEETARVKRDMQEWAQQAIDAAMKDVWNRLHDVLQRASEKLKAFTRTEEGVQNTFRDSLINNIRDLCSILPSLNITGAPELEQFGAMIMAQVADYPAEQLRDDDALRASVAAKADDILAKMQGYLA